MVAHTPGPWTTARAATPTDGEFDYAIGAMIEGRKYCIAEAFGRVSNGIRTPAEANARLCASAPDLLDALEQIVKAYDRQTIDLAKDAIAKATGAT